MSNPLFNIQYGLYVITTCDGGRDNGCICNTVVQVTAQPNRLSVALNKENYTTELIQRSGRFTVSIISEKADFELFKHFGFQSGRTVDKFANFTDCRRVSNGTLAVTRGTNTYLSVDVEQTIDLGTHILFIGIITAIQAMPYLMEYPYECNEQIFSRYYANTLATNIVNSRPRVKDVFNEWLNSTPDAFCSQLEKNPELKSVLLEETPWVLDAQNEAARKQNVALLFDLQRMAKEGKNACKKLEDQQNGDGGWSWFAGGQSSTYITEHIVAGVGHLQVLHVKSDLKSNTIQKAINFIDKKMNEYYQKWQKQNQTSSWGDIHYLYARSFFLSQKVSAAHQEAYNYNLANIKKNWKKQSIYMQGMIALICHRNGDTQTAKAIIANIKSMAQYSEELGMFWASMVSSTSP